jgi:C4-dicarboxylate-specific signal transduction histidine kinase
MPQLDRAIVRSPYLAAFATAAGYWAGTQVGLLLTPTGLAVSVMWPPNAVLLAALLMTPRSRWPLYLLAIAPVHVATQLSYGIPVGTSIGWYFTNIGEALLGALCLQWLHSPRELFQTCRGVLVFLTVGVIAVTGLMSFIDAAVVVLTGFDQQFWVTCRQRFVSNALATLTLVPAIVMIATSSFNRLGTTRRMRYLEVALLAAATLVIVNLISVWYGHSLQGTLGLTYSLLPLLLWAAVRFGPLSVSLLQLVSTSAILWTALNREPFSLSEVLSLQMLLAVLNSLSLTLSVVMSERRRLQAFHMTVLNSMRDAVAITDADGVVIAANPSWTTAEQTRSPYRLDGVPVHARYFDDRRAGAAHSPDAARMLTGLQNVLTGSHDLFEMEYSCQGSDEARWFSISVVPLKGGQPGAVITHSDMTERKSHEAMTQQLREELARAGRIMTMGMLSASLTHELSQPLSSILVNGQAAQRMCVRGLDNGGSELQEILTDIIAASRRAGGILRQLRQSVTNGDSSHRQMLNLNDVVRDVLDLTRGDLMRQGISVDRQLSPGLPCLSGDRTQLQQLVLNLILNACHAMRDNPIGDRTITVMTSVGEAGVQLSIADVGTGIDPAQLGTIFEPFFTTRRESLGLGLALCRWVALAHAGRLTAENNAVRGATFRCVMPLLDPRQQANEVRH